MALKFKSDQASCKSNEERDIRSKNHNLTIVELHETTC